MFQHLFLRTSFSLGCAPSWSDVAVLIVSEDVLMTRLSIDEIGSFIDRATFRMRCQDRRVVHHASCRRLPQTGRQFHRSRRSIACSTMIHRQSDTLIEARLERLTSTLAPALGVKRNSRVHVSIMSSWALAVVRVSDTKTTFARRLEVRAEKEAKGACNYC